MLKLWQLEEISAVLALVVDLPITTSTDSVKIHPRKGDPSFFNPTGKRADYDRILLSIRESESKTEKQQCGFTSHDSSVTDDSIVLSIQCYGALHSTVVKVKDALETGLSFKVKVDWPDVVWPTSKYIGFGY